MIGGGVDKELSLDKWGAMECDVPGPCPKGGWGVKNQLKSQSTRSRGFTPSHTPWHIAKYSSEPKSDVGGL